LYKLAIQKIVRRLKGFNPTSEQQRRVYVIRPHHQFVFDAMRSQQLDEANCLGKIDISVVIPMNQ
jgi:hypothetical protein